VPKGNENLRISYIGDRPDYEPDSLCHARATERPILHVYKQLRCIGNKSDIATEQMGREIFNGVNAALGITSAGSLKRI
jgi:hypothetical protein